jgi:hypothetical protein
MKNEIKTGAGWTVLTLRSSPNFKDKEGNAYLVRCPSCQRENYAPNVASGMCSWCPFNLNEFINTDDTDSLRK